ncbi:leucine-rich repeat neuronal protein 3 [Lingula anatina]|uniref:Leucine-rich repeat neuronal protein 3 n=1 Tax=Lingula anatina TaxID=7574 RepID=A0A1S3K9R6_LINAN|nr:leucine-rich repeat neuronal protein 3 [Lingula anatina]XP_013419187.1 leucine-rich repeat neuronal protein 3 [Lingula anatina]XP_013419188.1 leucine-rich repeat neuronal protein 3 [Lingula anatina]XP_013419189.1 leucine-rich repeat neuronal protein 3 [Lingula anatina]XP_013419190.1 leucine-rich repeat neuronal protein 3 [Lingula anatina]XP_013419191.1 leucine-rich repeat neuronal protein 3 [Lingula anatina]XP_023932040.1 leucine-rich repeat neuronal protein 3 [Lingula anatina]|eukprot:XP_013419186.1 leucine-rich repeat neuronal protein 3 [Lingula anatina]
MRSSNNLLLHLTILGLSCLTLTTAEVGKDPAEIWNTTCVSNCSCAIKNTDFGVKLKTVDCHNLNLLSIPSDLPLDTEALLLQGNDLTSVENTILPLPQLQHLDLSYNNLDSLQEVSVIRNLTSLRYLNLANNKLTSLSRDSFSGLHNLNKLFLSNNALQQIEPETLDELSSLRSLFLQENRLTSLNPQWFSNLPYLDELTLSANQLRVLPDGVFRPLRKLTKLSLNSNNINQLTQAAIHGIENLEFLYFDNNNLTVVPTQTLANLTNLKILSLNGNKFQRLDTGSFHDLPVLAELNLNNMPSLLFVDAGAFKDLSSLTILQLHDNINLTYLDANAFDNVPKLSMLYIHNNNLMALPEEIAKSSPHLQDISFYHNPIHCDCNARWIREWMERAKDKTKDTNGTVTPGHLTNHYSRLQFQWSDRLVCDTPPALNTKVLQTVPLESFSKTCAPTALPFFNASYTLELGDPFTIHCRAIGIPTPNIHYFLGQGKKVNETSSDSDRYQFDRGSLTITHVTQSDTGAVVCIAANNRSQYDTTSTRLKVKGKNVKILPVGVTENMVTVALNGSDLNKTVEKFHLSYKLSPGSDQDYKLIHILPNNTQIFTITELQPKTMYIFCITYEHNNYNHNLDCINISTDSKVIKELHNDNISTSNDVKFNDVTGTTVVTVIFVCVSVLTVLAVTLAFVRRFKQRQPYKEPDGMVYRLGSISNITLDSLYSPPSTPIHNLKTSLVKNAYGPSYA